MIKVTESEIKNREYELTASLDAKNLGDLQERQPEMVEKIRRLIEVGYTPLKIGRVIRSTNPQMWIESKFAESVARAISREGDNG